ncbi:hypothetical protein C1A50_3746 [Paenibacillus polymyxa]|nr:hypothetical protein C1A50_3746 [Paenibacillus polymyxa]
MSDELCLEVYKMKSCFSTRGSFFVLFVHPAIMIGGDPDLHASA